MISISNADVTLITKAIEDYLTIKPRDNSMAERQRRARLFLKKVRKKTNT